VNAAPRSLSSYRSRVPMTPSNQGQLATGMKQLVSHHVECGSRGAARCQWQLRWPTS
jgi:hypothetical protein